MSSTKSTSTSPISKVIFLQRIFRFYGRTVKDLAIINSVCRDFEETMQAHHTFNLVLYDNIIKKRKHEDGFLQRQIRFLETAPAWIVYQWTIVNEHDETQRELLKKLLLYQAKNEQNKILIRENVGGEDPSTTRELLCHIVDSCVKLGIAKEVLGASLCARRCITQAVRRNLPSDSLALLIDSCVQHGLDVKMMLGQGTDDNCIMEAVASRLAVDSFKLLIETCVQHGVDVKKMLEQEDYADRNCIMLSAARQLPFDSFKFLMELCIQNGVDVKKMVQHLDFDKSTCLLMASFDQLPIDSFRLLIAHFPSNESFRATLAVENRFRIRAVKLAKTEEIRTLLKDPNCWKKCREWCTSNGISTFRQAGHESGARRERE